MPPRTLLERGIKKLQHFFALMLLSCINNLVAWVPILKYLLENYSFWAWEEVTDYLLLCSIGLLCSGELIIEPSLDQFDGWKLPNSDFFFLCSLILRRPVLSTDLWCIETTIPREFLGGFTWNFASFFLSYCFLSAWS